MKIEIDLLDPATSTPPLNRNILAVMESVIYTGSKRRVHHDFRVLRIIPEDVDGDEDEGATIYGEVQRGETKWDDAQLRLEAGIESIDDCYSDSIVWWAEMPTLPVAHAVSA